MVADPVEGLLLELLSLVPCLEAVHECEHYHHRNTTNTAGLGERGESMSQNTHTHIHQLRYDSETESKTNRPLQKYFIQGLATQYPITSIRTSTQM